jgi:hypothetical protein
LALAEKRFSTAIDALERALARGGAHMLIGGVAVIARGVRRLTDDVDAAVWAEGTDLGELLARLAKQKIQPRIRDATAFARQNQVLLLRHSPSGIEIDLSLAWLPFERAALERADSIAIGRRRVPVAAPGDLIVYKAIAARARDLSDIERLLEIHGHAIDLKLVKRTIEELADALERPELVEGFERIVRATKARRASGTRPSAKKQRRRVRRS